MADLENRRAICRSHSTPERPTPQDEASHACNQCVNCGKGVQARDAVVKHICGIINFLHCHTFWKTAGKDFVTMAGSVVVNESPTI